MPVILLLCDPLFLQMRRVSTPNVVNILFCYCMCLYLDKNESEIWLLHVPRILLNNVLEVFVIQCD